MSDKENAEIRTNVQGTNIVNIDISSIAKLKPIIRAVIAEMTAHRQTIHGIT